MVSSDIEHDSVALKAHYESKIAEMSNKLQDTVEALEFDFREQLYERQELIRQLLVQLQLKNSEFVEFLTSVKDANDRKHIGLKVECETKLEQMRLERDALQLNEAVVEKKLSNAVDEHNQWNREKVELLSQHHLDQEKIRGLEKQLEILRTEIRSREETLNINENHLMECKAAIEEVSKRKENFTLTLKELQDECDGLKEMCKERNGKISYLTIELKQYEQDNAAKELSIDALKSKLKISRNQMETERRRRLTMETTLLRITEDLRITSESIQNIPELKRMVITLRQKYL